MRWLERLFRRMQEITNPMIMVGVDPAVKAQVRDARLFADYALAQPSATDIEPACKIIRNLAEKLEETTGGPK